MLVRKIKSFNFQIAKEFGSEIVTHWGDGWRILSHCHLFFLALFLGCKLLYKHDLAKRWGNHCKMCSYCLQTSPKLVQNHFGGKVEEFCSEDCMSKFTVLFYQVSYPGTLQICLRSILPLGKTVLEHSRVSFITVELIGIESTASLSVVSEP